MKKKSGITPWINPNRKPCWMWSRSRKSRYR